MSPLSRPTSRLVDALLRFSRRPAKRVLVGIVGAIALLSVVSLSVGAIQPSEEPPLWQVYQHSLKPAKYVDLTHTITPTIPVWAGFGPSKFLPTVNPKTGKSYTYEQDGFEATHYNLSTDQLGTQLDPPAHCHPYDAVPVYL